MKVLVVDDDPAVVAGIQAILTLHGFEADTALDRESAEERIASEFFPVILADLRMQQEDDGLRLIESVRRLSPRSRVATMTGAATQAAEAMLRERGAELVLFKPFDEEQLVSALRSMLEAVEDAAFEHADDDDALYHATIGVLRAIACGKFGFSSDACEDLVQETWLLFLMKRREIRTPKTWLVGTIANLCRQNIRKCQLARMRDAQLPDIAVHENRDAVLSVRTALERLDARSRALCTMIGIERRTYDDVSTAAKIPLGSVGPLYIRAKEKLRRALL